MGNLYRDMCIATNYNVKSIGGFNLLIQLWAWERCPTLVPSFIPPQQQNTPLAYRYTFFYYFELIINKYAWLMLIIILCNILFCYLIFYEDGWGEFHHIGNVNLHDFRCKLDVMKRDEVTILTFVY